MYYTSIQNTDKKMENVSVFRGKPTRKVFYINTLANVSILSILQSRKQNF